MQNAAFAARGLDVAYVPLGVPPEQLKDAVRGLVALGFLGANVTTPHKRAVVTALRRGRRWCRVGQHARDPRRSRTRLQHGHRGARGSTARQRRLSSERVALQLRGSPSSRRAVPRCVCSPGRASGRRTSRMPSSSSRRRRSRTSSSSSRERARSSSILRTARRVARPSTRRCRPCRRLRGRRGLEVLVLQGAASFERWTGLPAPVEIMRAAIRS